MKRPIDNFWQLKLDEVKEALEKNRFEVFVAGSAVDAKDLALNQIIPSLDIKTVSWGGVHVVCGHRLVSCINGSQGSGDHQHL